MTQFVASFSFILFHLRRFEEESQDSQTLQNNKEIPNRRREEEC